MASYLLTVRTENVRGNMRPCFGQMLMYHSSRAVVLLEKVTLEVARKSPSCIKTARRGNGESNS